MERKKFECCGIGRLAEKRKRVDIGGKRDIGM
jgi:hypothetical protein